LFGLRLLIYTVCIRKSSDRYQKNVKINPGVEPVRLLTGHSELTGPGARSGALVHGTRIDFGSPICEGPAICMRGQKSVYLATVDFDIIG